VGNRIKGGEKMWGRRRAERGGVRQAWWGGGWMGGRAGRRTTRETGERKRNVPCNRQAAKQNENLHTAETFRLFPSFFLPPSLWILFTTEKNKNQSVNQLLLLFFPRLATQGVGGFTYRAARERGREEKKRKKRMVICYCRTETSIVSMANQIEEKAN